MITLWGGFQGVFNTEIPAIFSPNTVIPDKINSKYRHRLFVRIPIGLFREANYCNHIIYVKISILVSKLIFSDYKM